MCHRRNNVILFVSTNFYKKTVLIFVIIVSLNLRASEVSSTGGDYCYQLFAENRSTEHQRKTEAKSLNIWSTLRSHRLLVNQNEVPMGETLCGPACAVNVVQAISQSLNQTPYMKPKLVLETVTKNGKFNGGANVEQILLLVKGILESELSEYKFKISAEIGRGIYKEFPDGKEIDQINHDELKPTQNKFKIVAFSLFDSDDRHLGNHYEIISAVSGNLLWLTDPMDPYNSKLKINLNSNRDINGVLVPSYINLTKVNGLKGVHSMAPLSVLTIELIP